MITWLFTFCWLFYHCNCQTEYWVRPLSASSYGCPSNKPCLTLSEYVMNPTAYFTSNTTFHFLPGTHCVMSMTSESVIIQNVQALSFVASDSRDNSSAGQARIDGKGRLMFIFSSVNFLYISGLLFENCGQYVQIEHSVIHSFIPIAVSQRSMRAALVVSKVSALVLENVTVEWSIGYGLLGLNTSSVNVTNCKFHHNNWRVDTSQSRVQNKRGKDEAFSSHRMEYTHGGNVLLVLFIKEFESSFGLLFNFGWEFTLNINNSEFSHGMTTTSIFGSGLSIYLSPGYAYYSRLSVLIHDSVFHNNMTPFGANMFLLYTADGREFTTETTIEIHNCSFNNGRSITEGGGLYIERTESSRNFLVYVTNSSFFNNYAEKGSGIFLHGSRSNSPGLGFQLKDCNFSNNTGRNGSALYIYNGYVSISDIVFHNNTASESGGAVYILSKSSGIIICITKTNFTENRAIIGSAVTIHAPRSAGIIVEFSTITVCQNRGLQSFDIHDSAAVLVEHGTVIVSNSNFSENTGTAIMAFNSSLYFEEEVRLWSNKGYSGGALALIMSSMLYLRTGTTVHITNNTALLYGGGIAVLSDDCNSPTEYCFFQIDIYPEYMKVFLNLKNLNFSEQNIKVILDNNKAGKLGDSIYGGNLDSCILTEHKSTVVLLNETIFWTLFEVTGEQSSHEMATNPYKVCFCSNKTVGHSCPTVKNVSHFKGETFLVAVLGTGQLAYASPAIVRVSIQQGNSAELGERQNIQEIGANCDNITLSIRTSEGSTVLELSIENHQVSDNQLSILSVSFLPCPFGFSLAGTPPKCDCTTHLKKSGVSCNIDSQLIHRPAAVWIGNFSDDVVIHSHCPFDYCEPEDNEISLYQQDEQCALNHARVLCGACQPGLSLALGSSRCMQCSNVWILLFVPFIAAGMVLVLLLLKCNLTVSTGTINGLIFYANIVRVNHAIFFPPGKIHPMTQILAVFIAWVNLDLGIETCLCEGMTALIKTWLQFLFPIYIWVMVGLMIIVSRYSTTVSRLTGYNTVSVLATLFYCRLPSFCGQ